MASSAPSSSSSKLTADSFDALNTQLQNAALKTIKQSVPLPADLAFHRSIDPALAESLDAFSARVLAVTNSLLALADTGKGSRAKGKGKLESQDDVVDSFHSVVVDSMDRLLEGADTSLDEFLGRSKAPAIAVNPIPPKNKKPNAPRGRLDPALTHAAHLVKPQTRFVHRIDNDPTTPWLPRLRVKHNAQVPWAPPDVGDRLDVSKLHPYHYEITHTSYPPHLLTPSAPIPPKSFDDTPFAYVDTPAAFASLLTQLKGAKEIAVDLEHHQLRTFAGLVCLMQISTREGDWVVDCLALREEVQALNEVFTDPAIVKVFHGAESDIVWLQQDFSVYVVNLFDTFHASKLLEFPRHGLANLLEMYCDYTADKRYQLADWRIRPLPEEMLLYARSDTHFLLYIYDSLRNALLDRGASQSRRPTPTPAEEPAPAPTDPRYYAGAEDAYLRAALARSEQTALRIYEKEGYDAERGTGVNGWDTLARKWNRGLLMRGEDGERGGGGPTGRVYRAVHAWRDRVAREEDESTRYVLSNQYLFLLAERVPGDMPALLDVFHGSPPQVVRRRAKELLEVIQRAAKEGETQAVTSVAVEVTSERAGGRTSTTGESGAVSAVTVDSSRLWAKSSVPSTSSTSSLFGSILSKGKDSKKGKERAAASTYVATSSALFGSKAKSTAAPSLPSVASTFADVVRRIHSALVVVPAAPKVVSQAPDTAVDVSMAEPPPPTAADTPAEIAFVPLSQRRPVEENGVDDAIVVVGQRQKKRKRARTKSAVTSRYEANGAAAADSSPEVEDTVAFDYASVPNILDDAPVQQDSEGRKRKKQKQGKGATIAYGNFPAPPKAHRELKSGNQAHTFKK